MLKRIVIFFLFMYAFVFPPVVIYQSAKYWDGSVPSLVKEIGLGSLLYFIGCIAVCATAYTAFAGLFYQQGPSRIRIPIVNTVTCTIGFILLHYANVNIYIFGHSLSSEIYGIIGVVIGLILAIVHRPSHEEIGTANRENDHTD